MRVGLITSRFLPEMTAGTVRYKSFIEAWATEEDEVCVFTSRSFERDKKAFKKEELFEGRDNVYVYRTAVGVAGNRWGILVRLFSELLFCVLAAMQMLRRRVDVYVVSSPSFLLAVTTVIMAKALRTPYVADIRDIYPDQLFEYGVIEQESLLGRFLCTLEQIVYDEAILIGTVTEGLKDEIEKRTDTEVVVVRNGIDTGLFWRKPTSRLGDKFKILFHGTLGVAQNIDYIIRYARFLAEEEIHDIEIVVVGDGPKRERLEESIQEYGLEGVLSYDGFVRLSKIPNYIRGADLGFSPRQRGTVNETSFPVKVYECLGCGVPVIVSPHGEAGEFLKEHEVGYQVPNDSVNRLHDAVVRLKNDHSQYREYSERAAHVALSFDRHDIAQKYLHRIRQLL